MHTSKANHRETDMLLSPPTFLLRILMCAALYRTFTRIDAAAYPMQMQAQVTPQPEQLRPLLFKQSEYALQRATIMAWPTKHSLRGDDIAQTRTEIAAIARAIALHQHVLMFVHDDKHNINVDSLWARDTAPSFVVRGREAHELAGVQLNFNEWGHKTHTTRDARFAKAVNTELKIRPISTWLHMEGGALEVDGQGTFMGTLSSIVNPNRNKGASQADIEAEMSRLFGIRRFIWLPGTAGIDITDDHVDSLARFGPNNTIIVAGRNYFLSEKERADYVEGRRILDQAVNFHQQPYRIVEVPDADFDAFSRKFGEEDDTTLSYVNFALVNGAVLVPSFDDNEADGKAVAIFRSLFVDREIVQIPLQALAQEGGGIHCATQELPFV
ncbi:hypothetical protein FA10DRAFT_96893 [Acaromyces ingoldii]|uniref:Agmatine deiminase n=1 Tax=Acaromyces ingoldii TaxID=215250 RepID=A0A316YNY8_9BASI|nr:hypothetical protein FA10DRAFT_96893 [Acaromyces ingoldii]PWN89763.1 hypothetical protein FA10DRAFT_96893 [Acaromyces ingoldii]